MENESLHIESNLLWDNLKVQRGESQKIKECQPNRIQTNAYEEKITSRSIAKKCYVFVAKYYFNTSAARNQQNTNTITVGAAVAFYQN